MTLRVLALDLGASSGRAIVGTYDGSALTLEEIHRFPNDPVRLGNTLYWDVLRLVHEIKQALLKAKPYGISCIGIDTWGVDFGLLDSGGRLLANPVHYRDTRTAGMKDHVLSLISPQKLYSVTGNQIMEINTLFQTAALSKQDPALLASADKLLLMPDLLGFFLTGEIAAERSIASTTQFYDWNTGDWAYEIAGMFGVRKEMLPVIQDAGTVRGKLSKAICDELGLVVCGHDTQSAMAAVTAEEPEFTFLSCGTWSLLGRELSAPILTDEARKAEFTNEAGYGGKTAFLKNLTGLWILQESRRQFARNGRQYTYADMEKMARAAGEQSCRIDTDDPRFAADGDLPQEICKYCAETGQPVPADDAGIIRCIYDSLAGKYRETLELLAEVTGKPTEKLYVIGGGTKDRLLMELTERVCGIPVIPCGTEATALGNCAVQTAALENSSDPAYIRRILQRKEL